jgi:rare lipoprotein A
LPAAPDALFPTKGPFVGSTGRHRLNHAPRSLRTVLITIAGLAVAVVAVTVVAIGGSGSSSAQTSDRSAPADPPRVPYRASRDATRTPIPTPSPSAQPSEEAAPAKHRRHHEEILSHGRCEASYYGTGQTTASGEHFDPSALTAAHRTLPLGSKVRVINRDNDRSVVVRINDRGPFVPGRCLDLSSGAMRAVGGMASGVIPVRYEVLARL